MNLLSTEENSELETVRKANCEHMEGQQATATTQGNNRQQQATTGNNRQQQATTGNNRQQAGNRKNSSQKGRQGVTSLVDLTYVFFCVYVFFFSSFTPREDLSSAAL
jgi:hypothetical protein